jgi:hypothetical protein
MLGRWSVPNLRAISVNGWSGAGYSVIDPETGAGGYLIEGGANGGFMKFIADNSTNIGIGLFIAGLVALLFAPWVGILIAIVALVVSAIALYVAYEEAISNAQCPAAVTCINAIALLTLLLALAGLIAIGAPPIVGLILGIVGLIFGDDFFKAVSSPCNSLGCRASPEP